MNRPLRRAPTEHAARFFALRTPLLPRETGIALAQGLQAPGLGAQAQDHEILAALTADRRLIRARLADLARRPAVREALLVASSSLDAALESWLPSGEDETETAGQHVPADNPKVERTLVRYLMRMSQRPTPFGLFAGISVGEVGAQTRLTLASASTYERRTRIDSQVLSEVASARSRAPVLRRMLRFHPSFGIYRAGGALRQIARIAAGPQRGYDLVSIDRDPALDRALMLAAPGIRLSELVHALAESEGVDQDEAESFVDELVEQGLLEPDLVPALTGGQPALDLAQALDAAGDREAADRLRAALAALAELDAGGVGNHPARYQPLFAGLEALRPAGDLPQGNSAAHTPAQLAAVAAAGASGRNSPLVQVDLVKPAGELCLGSAVLTEMAGAVELLRRITPPADDLAAFRQAFQDRYGEREVALAEALDEEAGVGFTSPPAGRESPLLAGMRWYAGAPPAEGSRWNRRHAHLLRRLGEVLRSGDRQLTLLDADIEALSVERPAPLPDAFALRATLLAANEARICAGDYRLWIQGTAGPPSVALLGRFLHLDPRLEAAVRQDLADEEALQPDCIFAELVHTPLERHGNVVLRPCLRHYEIPLLGRSGLPRERHLALDDLAVSVRGNRVVLRSQRLRREVKVRLTSAHNHADRRNISFYRFLCALMSQGLATPLRWSWATLDEAPFLPRVAIGRLVLSPARWNVAREELAEVLAAEGAQRWRALRSLRARLALPRWVALEDRDNVLPVDLDNVLGVDSLLQLLRPRRGMVRIVEALAHEDSCVTGPEGSFAHELIVPFVRRQGLASERSPAPSRPGRRMEDRWRSYPPGSEWLFAKIYCGPASADRLLAEAIAPLAAQARQRGWCDRWFFIRYADPEWHLRVRWHGQPATVLAEVLTRLHEALAEPLAEGRVASVQLDSYRPELERYGGLEAMPVVEELFQADSDATIAVLVALERSCWTGDARWQAALLGVDALLGDLGFAAAEKLALVDRWAAAFAEELRPAPSSVRLMSSRFREHRTNLTALVNGQRAPTALPAWAAPVRACYRARSARLCGPLESLRGKAQSRGLTTTWEDLAGSLVHMQLNRLLRSAHRMHEAVLYSFLRQIYRSQQALAASRQEPGEGEPAHA